jgi:hypothetical protein
MRKPDARAGVAQQYPGANLQRATFSPYSPIREAIQQHSQLSFSAEPERLTEYISF